MTSKNSITNLLRFDLLEITPELFIHFHWGVDGDAEGLFKNFYEQIETYAWIEGESKTPLDLGHFEFFESRKGKLETVDGKQRLISLLVILESILSKLKIETKLDDNLALIDAKISSCFSIKDLKQTDLAKVNEYLKIEFKHKAPAFLIKLFNTIENATFSKRTITDKEQGVQVQSNLARFNSAPSNFEKFESYCYNNALKADKEHRDWILNRFSTDFKYIRSRFQGIKFAVSEDVLFEVAAQCHDHSLKNGVVERSLEWYENSGTFKLKYDFINELLQTINALNEFFNHGPNASFEIHEYISFNYCKNTLPFIAKAYMNKVPLEEIVPLTESLLKVAFRCELMGVGKNLSDRLINHFLPAANYSNSIKELIETIENLSKGKKGQFVSDCNNFKKALNRSVLQHHQKFILWVYENALRKERGLDVLYYNALSQFEVVKIKEDEKDNLGNLLLVHNEQMDLSEKDFFKSLSLLNQQKEIVELIGGEEQWTKEMRKQRHQKIRAVIYRKFK